MLTAIPASHAVFASKIRRPMVSKQPSIKTLCVYALFLSVAMFMNRIEFVYILGWHYYWIIAVYFANSFVAGLPRRKRFQIVAFAILPVSHLIATTLIWLTYSTAIWSSFIVGVFVLFVPVLSILITDLFETKIWITYIRYGIEIFVVFPAFMLGLGLWIWSLGWVSV
ncbi:MAG: hypothetical protein JNK57_05430 [Planctomycetaceae bacterium]|nr:hypothetical protein [Planctomycetaceae bacterium]